MSENISSKAILFALSINGQGGGAHLKNDKISDLVKSTALTWVHMDANNPDTLQWLKKEASYLDDLILDALLDSETRPRILEFKEGILMILRGVNLNKGNNPEDMISIRLWIDEYRIISLQCNNFATVNDIVSSLDKGKGPKNSGEFTAKLLLQLFDRMDPILVALNDSTDDIEEQVMESPDYNEREIIVSIRKQAIMFRRYMLPQKEVIQALLLSDLPWLQMHMRHIHESHNMVQRYIEDLDAIRERSQVIKDELTNSLSDRMNKNLYILSLIAAIFLPLNFLTSLLGVNVGGIPGASNGNAFWIFTISLIILVSLQFWFFRKFKWV